MTSIKAANTEYTITCCDNSESRKNWTFGYGQYLTKNIPKADENECTPPNTIDNKTLVHILSETLSTLLHPGEGICLKFEEPSTMDEDYKTALRRWVGVLLKYKDEHKNNVDTEWNEYLDEHHPLSGDLFPEEEHRDTRWKAKRTGRKPKLKRKRITYTDRSHNSGKSHRPLTIV